MPFRRLFVALGDWFAPSRQLEAPVVEEVLTRHAGSLMRLRGVMSVGVGRTADGRPAIFLGIDNPQAASVSDLPESVEGVPVVHRAIGKPEARQSTQDLERVEQSARMVARREYHALDLGEPFTEPIEEPSAEAPVEPGEEPSAP